jgi:hypothetical protein
MAEEVKRTALPVDLERYIDGPGPESLQFDFLIGDWAVEGTRFSPSGDVLATYFGRWQAEYRHDKRMVVDDFSIHLPNGQEISSFVTVRSYSPLTQRWEIAGLGAFQPALQGEWFGNWTDGTMILQAKGKGPEGHEIRNLIKFHEITPESFHWESRTSLDGGVTWILAASVFATRRTTD